METVQRKKELRKTMRGRLASLTSEELVAGKMGLFDSLSSLTELDDSTRLMGFHPHRNEIDCRYFLRVWISKGRDLFLPKVDSAGLELEVWRVSDILSVAPGFRGMMEPDPTKCERAEEADIDAVLVPGTAFDRNGMRLGQGAGHFDKMFARLGNDILKIGIGYDWQLLDEGQEIPTEPHDVAMDLIVTPNHIVRVGK